jgi:integrase
MLAQVSFVSALTFRHTFAVSLLQKGVGIEIVSVLLAHSSIRVTERHYAPWVALHRALLKSDADVDAETVLRDLKSPSLMRCRWVAGFHSACVRNSPTGEA